MKKMITTTILLVVLSMAITQVSIASAASPASPSGPGDSGDGHGPDKRKGQLHDLRISAWAEALGLTKEELETRLENGDRIHEIAAELGYEDDEFTTLAQEVRESVLSAAVAEGIITEEQAEGLTDPKSLRKFVLRRRIVNGDGPLHDYVYSALANQLGMRVEELEAALDDGKTLVEIAEEQGIDTSLREILQNARQEAREQAIEDGVIDEGEHPLREFGRFSGSHGKGK